MNKNFKYAVVQTIPIMLGFIFLGVAFGLLVSGAGYGVGMSLVMAIVIYGGSLQFALVPLMTSGASLTTVAFISLSLSSRQMFYGLSFIERFKKMGKKALFMVHTLCDETYSVLCSDIPEDIDESKFSFYVALLDYIYWIVGCGLGAAVGSLITFNTTGIDFAMVALFIVIVIEQWLGSKNHIPAIAGAVSAIVCLIIFGANSFILPSLIVGVAVLMAVKSKVQEEQ